MRCVASPIVNADGWPVAALSLSGPSSRMTRTALEGIRAQLAEACQRISRTLSSSR
jgi:IclR family acetate operon transcriptional repressor